jgi:hypothetical protein
MLGQKRSYLCIRELFFSSAILTRHDYKKDQTVIMVKNAIILLIVAMAMLPATTDLAIQH